MQNTGPMSFALLGDDSAALPLLRAATESGHKLIRAVFAERLRAQNGTLAAMPQSRWEDLLIDGNVEAVIVAGDSEEIQTAAKQLAASGKPLLIVPKAEFGAACAYELSLIHDDSQVVLMPAFAHRNDVDLQALSQRMKAGELGAVRRLQIEVELPASGDGDSRPLLAEGEIEAAAILDIDLLRWLGGNYDQVTSLRSGQTERGCSQATLTLAGAGLPDATWNARRGDAISWRLTIETERGSEVISLAAQSASRNASQLLLSFVEVCRGEHAAPCDWSDAVRVFDVLDAARRSLRRRRTIDLHFEALSERSQFKTQMTAIGCGLLVLTLILMLGLLGLGSLLDSRDRAFRDSASAGLLLTDSDFESHTAELTSAAQTRLGKLAEQLKEEPKSVYLEPSDHPPAPELDQRRREQVAVRLKELGVVAADHRTLLAPSRSSAWDTLMRVLRVAWIAPLVVFLLLQALLFVAKPASIGKRERPPSGS